VQIRPNLYDFLLMFGIASQNSPDAVNIQNFQGVYLSPQQAKALSNLLQENIRHYESAFGEIHVEQRPGASGPLQ
jgi:flagellar protein FlaG